MSVVLDEDLSTCLETPLEYDSPISERLAPQLLVSLQERDDDLRLAALVRKRPG
jgi:hypothetical protein